MPELLSALSLGAWLLLATAVGLLLYGYIADRVIFEAGGCLRTEKFGPVDAVIATVLGTLLLVGVVNASLSPAATPDSPLPSASQEIGNVVANDVVFAVVIGGILGALTVRQITWREVFGLNRQRPLAVLGLAALLILAAFPLVGVASVLWQLLVAGLAQPDGSSQDLVRFLAHSDSREARLVVGFTAVFVAPAVEEIIFRGYLYGVLRRYAGVVAGIIVNAALFAAVHTHLPSFGGLFVLAVCLCLAYEWTGSIFVNMTMHALFNAFNVAQILSGGITGACIHAH